MTRKHKIILGIGINLLVAISLIKIDFNYFTDLSKYSPEVGKGTLIVIVPAKKGIVVCSDKRIYRKSIGDVDTMNKLIKIGNNSAFAVVGAPIVWHSGRKIFDVFDIVKNFFNRKEIIDADTTWTKIQTVLTETFKDSILSLNYSDWPESEYPQKNYVLFEIIFFHHSLSGAGSMSLIQFTYVKQQEPIYKANVYALSAKGSFTAFGSGHVIMELQNGHDKRFDKFRNNSKLKPFLNNSLIPKEIHTDDAKYFAQKMIQISSANYSLVSEIDGHISPNCNCAILDSKNGFIWLK